MKVGEKEEELTRRFRLRLINKAKSCEECLSVASEAAIALKSGVYTMHDVRNGGVFGALWELSRKIGVGLTIDLRDIPIRYFKYFIRCWHCQVPGFIPVDHNLIISSICPPDHGSRNSLSLQYFHKFLSVLRNHKQ